MKLKTIFAVALCLLGITTAKAQTYSGEMVAEEGAWCWFADPRALHYETEDKSINATYIGYIDSHGSIKATQVDWTTNTTNEVLIRSWFQPDDHDNPAFLVLPDKRIMIIYSRHTDEAAFYYRISKRPGDITCLGDEKRLATANNTTYPNPYILADDPDHIYMCWRGIGWHPTVAQMSMPDANDNIKFTWGPYQMVQSTGARPYAKYMSDGKSKIYLAYTTGHPDNEQPNWLYCNVFDVNDKCLYDMKGKKLSTVQNGTFKVYKTSDYKNSYPATVVDSPSDKRDWIWNMAFAKDGNPVIGLTRINGGKTEHDYYYAKWNGSAWKVSFVANGGGQFHLTPGVEMCYSSGMAIDRDNPNIAYCGVPVEGTYGKLHEIWKYTLGDDGTVLSKEAVTKNSKKANARPFVIEGTQNSPLRLSWMNGDYYYWIVSNAYPKGYPTSIMSDYALPVTTASTLGLSVCVDLTIDQANYGGKILALNGVEYGLDADSRKPYIAVGGKKYMSQNVLGTADSWKNHSGTTDGTWPSIALLKRWNLTLTYDQTNNRLTSYRNGIIDQQIECEISTAVVELELNEKIGAIHKYKTYTDALSQDRIKALVAEGEMDAIEIPAQAYTDIVLPATVNNKEIIWTSNNTNVLSATGIVNQPKTATEVILTATVGEKTKDFTVTVLPRDIAQNVRALFTFDEEEEGITLMGNAKITDGKLDLTANTAAGFSTNGYAVLDQGLLKDLRSYTVLLTVNAKSLNSQPRFYDFGAASGNSVFLRAKALSAGLKLNGGTTTMENGKTTLATGKEYKLAVTFDAATKTTTIYVDGVEDAKGTAVQNEPYMIYEAAGDARNYIGRTQWWDTGSKGDNVDFVGTMDDIVVYDIALTQKEICTAQGLPFEEKEYAKVLVNGDFESAYSKLANSGVSSDRAIYVPEGWDVHYDTRNENDLTALKDGDLYYSQFFAPKPQVGGVSKQTMWIRQRWGSSVIGYSQTLRPEEGTYTLTADILTSDTSGKSYVYVNKQQLTSNAANAWQTVTYEFEADGEEVFEIGVCSSHPDGDGERICGFDNVKLAKKIDDAITTVKSGAADSKVNVYAADGTLVRKNVSAATAKNGLHSGIYVIGGEKVMVK